MSINIALVGCGAIARTFYLPALSTLRARFDRVWLIDPRADVAALAHGVGARHARALADVHDELQLAIVATPNAFHASVAHEAIARGAHVLIEKPYVVSPEDGRRLIAAATAAHRVIAINQTRRLYSTVSEIRRRFNDGEWGAFESASHVEGTKLAWPFESGAGFCRGAERTGVIMDFGVHVVDLYHHLLAPTWELTTATHDGFHGPEGLADIELRASGAPVSIRLSRYYSQQNVARLHFERAEVGFGVYDANTYWVRTSPRGTPRHAACGGRDTVTHAESLILNFIAASEGREAPICDPASSQPVIDLLDQVYTRAARYPAAIGGV